jgi:hypothetical protein
MPPSALGPKDPFRRLQATGYVTMIKNLLCAAALATACASPAFALSVTKSASVQAPPAKVWAVFSRFCSIGDWHPAIQTCTPSMKGGMHVRTLALKGGGTIVEERVSYSNQKMSYTYKILSSPLPVSHYKSTLSVAPDGSGSTVTWTGTFQAKGADDAKAEDVIGGIYDAGLKGIADKAQQ